MTREGSLISDDKRRASNGKIALLMPQKVVHKYRDRSSKGGKIIDRSELLADTEYTTVQRYQAVLQGVYNYYCMAVNVSGRMGTLKWILETSLTKTLACKLRCSVNEVFKRHTTGVLGRKVLQAIHERPGKDPLVAVFGGFAFKRIPEGLGVTDFRHASAWFAPGGDRSEIVQRLQANTCELCGKRDLTEVHHIRKLADIDRPGRRPKTRWEKIMSARKRKTLAVCGDCHDAIHAGRYDGPAL